MPGPFLRAIAPHERQKLGKYDLLGRLSTSGVHAHFLAVQTGMAGFRKVVVLKTILPDIRGEEESDVRSFLEEARIASSFTHPNVGQVFDLDTDDQTLFLAMEFVQGATLAEMDRPPIGFVLTTVRDAALALHYAHTFSDSRGRAQPVVHRKVSPKNIMVTFEGTVKLIDFGLAKALASGVNITSIGQVKGSGGYMSPEQVLGETVDPRTDVFSLGVVLHEGLTGKRLFERPTLDEEMRAALEDVAPPSKSNVLVGPALDHVTMKALARNLNHRYSTALELARAIESAADGMLWHPEQLGDLVKELHSDRLKQIHQVVLAAQGASGEVSGLHRTEFSTATNPAIIVPIGGEAGPPPFDKVTAEHPAFTPPDGRDELTAPQMPVVPRPAGRDAPTQSMRGPSQMNLKSVPAYDPKGPIHDSGARPAVSPPVAKPPPPPPNSAAFPAFAHVTLDEPTSKSDAAHRGDAAEPTLPPTVPFVAEEAEPRTTIARPHRPRGMWALFAVLGVAAVGFVVWSQGWIPREWLPVESVVLPPDPVVAVADAGAPAEPPPVVDAGAPEPVVVAAPADAGTFPIPVVKDGKPVDAPPVKLPATDKKKKKKKRR